MSVQPDHFFKARQMLASISSESGDAYTSRYIRENSNSISKSISTLSKPKKERILRELTVFVEKSPCNSNRLMLFLFQKVYPLSSKPVLRRQMSAPNLGTGQSAASELAAVNAKTSIMWNCKKRELDTFGGYLYAFEMKSELIDLEVFRDKNLEIYPAVEAHAFQYLPRPILNLSDLGYDTKTQKSLKEDLKSMPCEAFSLSHTGGKSTVRMFSASIQASLWKQLQKQYKEGSGGKTLPDLDSAALRLPGDVAGKFNFIKGIQAFGLRKELKKVLQRYLIMLDNPQDYFSNSRDLEHLGIQFKESASGSLTMIFPDHEALSARWELLRQTAPERNLPPLAIRSSEGIASDEDFVLALLCNDALLSEGEEFIHDYTQHLLGILRKMLAPTWANTYTQDNYKFIMAVSRAYKNFKVGAREWESMKPFLRMEIYDLLESREEQVMTAIGFFTDLANAGGPIEAFRASDIRNYYKDSPLVPELTRRYGAAALTSENIQNLETLWLALSQVTETYKVTSQLSKWLEKASSGEQRPEAARRIVEASLAGSTLLDLSELRLTQLPEGVIAMLPYLKDLKLLHNSLKQLPLDLCESTSLRTIDLSYNPELQIPQGCKLPKALIVLRMAGCNLQLSEELQGMLLSVRGLKGLDLSNNLLTELPPVLGLLGSLKKIILRANQISMIRDLNYSWPALVLLDLKNNQIRTLPTILERSNSGSIVYGYQRPRDPHKSSSLDLALMSPDRNWPRFQSAKCKVVLRDNPLR